MKNKLITILTVATMTQILSATNTIKDVWNNYDIFKINKESPSAMMKVFGNSSDAQKPISIADIDKIHEGDRYKLLNGKWKFFFANSRKDVKDNFFDKNFDDSKWNLITVPNSWQCEGYDNIFYDNITMQFMFDEKGNMLPDFVNDPSPFKRDRYAKVVDKPYIPEKHQQAGIYRRTFTVPQEWNNQNVFIRFDGVRTGFKLFVNGKFVGYSEDSFTPAEFNITNYIERGKENSLAVEVYKYSTGSYNEMQDMPHVMGIIRDVFLLARPNVYVKDYHAPATLNADLDKAEIDLTVTLRNISDKSQDNIDVEVLLVDEKGEVFGKSMWKSSSLLKEVVSTIPAKTLKQINKKVNVSGFKLWNPDKPNFYGICIKLSQNGKELETIRADFGFRKYKIVNRHMELNNVKMLIKGVNRHDWSPSTGKAVSFAEMKKDVELMKEANVNFVRTSHYPNDDRFYMLCTRYGVAMLDENNHEQHAFIRNPALNLPNHVPQAVDRAENMVFRDRNIPSIMIFSVGNESSLFYTLGHKVVEQVVRKHSPQHYFMSHGETYDIVNGAPNGTSDFVTPMYRDITQMERYLEMETNKPFFFPEYAHGMGNSIGNLEGMWRMLRKHEGLNGGFIWDWVDQSLYLPCENDPTKKYLSDGRDWNTIPTKQNFCCNGIIFADRTVSAKFYEVKKVYQHIFIDNADKCPLKLKITNDFIDTNTDEFDAIIAITRDGDIIAQKQIDAISVAPGQTKEISVQLPVYESSPIGEYFYTLSFVHKNDTLWAKKGDVVATEQVFLKKVNGKNYKATGTISTTEDNNNIVVKAGDSEIVFSKQQATLTSYKIGGKNMIVAPVEFDLKSAYIDNHKGSIKRSFESNRMHLLTKASSSVKLQQIVGSNEQGALRVFCDTIYDNGRKQGFKTSIVYTILGDGSMQVASQAVKINTTPRYMHLPRIGLRMGINKDMQNVTFLGKGPFANYIDRASAANVGLYKSTVADWFEPFTYVQDTGNREKVRWLALSKGKKGVLFTSDEPLPMAVLPYTQDELQNAKHPYLLPKTSATDLRISAKVVGLGNNSCGLPPRDEFCVDFKGSLEWKFTVRPVEQMANVVQMGRQTFPTEFDFSHKHFDKNLKIENLKSLSKIETSKQKHNNVGEGSDY
ncbi:MAG: DUF4981 domain-containing protein [Verrucomicrobiaceae bacterium]|nr:DUF4981 domain-containing protein [Verrucomicrobiaceae bacterium]